MTSPMTSPMTSDEARTLIDAALDGELSSTEQAAFEQALARDAELRAEYDRHAEFVKETRSLSRVAVPQGVDLLAGVQQRLRERSGGRFYRDRFAEARGRMGSTTWMLALAAIVLLTVAAFLAFDAGMLQSAPTLP